MGCCHSKASFLVDNGAAQPCTEQKSPKTDGFPAWSKALGKTSYGSSTIHAGAYDGRPYSSYVSSKQRNPSNAMSAVTCHTNSDHLGASSSEETEQHDVMSMTEDKDSAEFQDVDTAYDDPTVTDCESVMSIDDIKDIEHHILSALQASNIYQGVDFSLLEKMVAGMKTVSYEDGEVILSKGEISHENDGMYYVACGKLQIRGTSTITKGVGSIVGDLDLIFDAPRPVSVIASGKCLLYVLPRAAFVELLRSDTKISMLRFLRKQRFLKNVSDTNLVELANKARLETFSKHSIFNLSEDRFYLVRKGEVLVDHFIDQESRRLCKGRVFEVEAGCRYGSSSELELISIQKEDIDSIENFNPSLRLVEDQIDQILQNIGSIDFRCLNIANLIERTPILTLTRNQPILQKDDPLDHLYIILKGDIEIHSTSKSDLEAFRVKSFCGSKYFGEDWEKKSVSPANVMAASEEVQYITISHRILSVAGLDESKCGVSKKPCLSNRVLDAFPLNYEQPEIQFRDLTQLRVVGEGEYGAVRLVVHEPTQKQYALKIMSKAAIRDTKTAEHIIMERKILVVLDQMNFLVGLRGAYQDASCLYLLMDWVPGGELFSRIINSGGRLSNSHAVFYAANVVLAFRSMHRHNIIYRDLKPENILLDRNGYLKLADYGFATLDDEKAWTVCGTPDYQAPEIISRRGASKASDFWALGVLIFEMLTGNAPFKSLSNNRREIHRRILSGKYCIPDYVSPVAADLIRKLLQVDPTKRLGYKEGDLERLQRHPWFKRIDWNQLNRQTAKAPFLPKLTDALDTSCFDVYNTQTRFKAPSKESLFFDKDRPWSNLWDWIDAF